MLESLIPLYCLAGFVGSGKTTALLSILRQNPDRSLGVIFTEPVLLHSDDEPIEIEALDNGSMQCSCGEDKLADALEQMTQKAPEMIFVEVSGLSDPAHICKILESNPHCALQGIICLIDADNFMEQIQDVEMVKRQLAHCHMAVINKADLVAPELLGMLKAQIRRINPDCEIVSCSYGGFSLELLERDLLAHHTSREEAEDVGRLPDSIVLNCPEKLERDKIAAFLTRFIPETYRIKGFCLFENGWNQVDVVGARIHFSPCQAHSSSRLIFISKIGHALSEPLKESWNELIGLPMQLHD